MIWEVLVLGFVLSLDNFRVSIALGTVPFGLKRAVQVALTFGLWDAIMPLIGLLIGREIGEAVGDVAGMTGELDQTTAVITKGVRGGVIKISSATAGISRGISTFLGGEKAQEREG